MDSTTTVRTVTGDGRGKGDEKSSQGVNMRPWYGGIKSAWVAVCTNKALEAEKFQTYQSFCCR